MNFQAKFTNVHGVRKVRTHSSINALIEKRSIVLFFHSLYVGNHWFLICHPPSVAYGLRAVHSWLYLLNMAVKDVTAIYMDANISPSNK